jgi:hypothetical protein
VGEVKQTPQGEGWLAGLEFHDVPLRDIQFLGELPLGRLRLSRASTSTSPSICGSSIGALFMLTAPVIAFSTSGGLIGLSASRRCRHRPRLGFRLRVGVGGSHGETVRPSAAPTAPCAAALLPGRPHASGPDPLVGIVMEASIESASTGCDDAQAGDRNWSSVTRSSTGH